MCSLGLGGLCNCVDLMVVEEDKNRRQGLTGLNEWA